MFELMFDMIVVISVVRNNLVRFGGKCSCTNLGIVWLFVLELFFRIWVSVFLLSFVGC